MCLSLCELSGPAAGGGEIDYYRKEPWERSGISLFPSRLDEPESSRETAQSLYFIEEILSLGRLNLPRGPWSFL